MFDRAPEKIGKKASQVLATLWGIDMIISFTETESAPL